MSPLSSTAKINKYTYESKKGSQFIEGVMTNEAPTKAVIGLLEEKGDSNRLDKVVMICSDAVKKTITLKEGENDLKNLKQVDIKKCMEDSHIEFYKKLINSYAKEINPSYINSPIEYETVGIADFTEAEDVSKSVIEAANKVSEAGEKVNLFIDFNGGQRYVAFMILAIANLMKIRQVNIEQIMTMNFDNKVDGIVPIQNMESVFSSFDLIAGINEYINYGRIKTLRSYFKPSSNKEIKEILAKMEEFSNNLQLCRTGYVMSHRNELLKMLKDYSEKKRETEVLDTYEQLFEYVVNDILTGYEGLLTGDLPDIIKWCVDNDFIQQALTFTSEEMPGYFWGSGLFKASASEEAEYDKFLEKVHDPSSEEYKTQKQYYRKKHSKNSSKYAYEWMINYLPQPDKVRTNKKESDNIKKKPDNIKKELDNIKKELKNLNKNKIKDNKVLEKATKYAAPLIWHTKQRNGRAVCGRNGEILFKEVIILYFALKEQRNLTNHADGETGEADSWSYEYLCEVLVKLCNALEKWKKCNANRKLQRG